MQGIYNREHRTAFQGGSTNRILLAADAPSAELLVAARTGHTLYVTHIGLSVTTSAAQSVTLQDTSGVALAALPASAAIGPYWWHFGDEGVPLTEGAGLTLSVSSAGVAALVHVEWYFRQTAALTIAELRQA